MKMLRKHTAKLQIREMTIMTGQRQLLFLQTIDTYPLTTSKESVPPKMMCGGDNINSPTRLSTHHPKERLGDWRMALVLNILYLLGIVIMVLPCQLSTQLFRFPLSRHTFLTQYRMGMDWFSSRQFKNGQKLFVNITQKLRRPALMPLVNTADR